MQCARCPYDEEFLRKAAEKKAIENPEEAPEPVAVSPQGGILTEEEKAQYDLVISLQKEPPPTA